MNKDNLKSVTDALEEIEKIDISERIGAQFSDKDLETILWQEITALEFPELVARVVGQLRAEIDKDGFRFYPSSFPSEAVQPPRVSLAAALQQFGNTLRSSNWPEAARWLKILIEYQVFCGFWDRGPKQYSFTRLRREAVLRQFETRQKQALATVAEARKTLSEVRDAIGAIKASKDEIAQLTGSVRKNAEEVGALLAKASGNNGRLEEMVSTEEQRVEQADLHLKMATEGLNAVTAKTNDLAALLKDSEDRIAVIKEKETLVNEIAGTAAAGVLGKKFEARRQELEGICKWWLGGLGVALALAGAWLWVTHKYFHLDGVMFWAQIASNFGLMLPALFVVAFAAAQYLKERNFQEEYAFRASVAMTLKAFADEMGSGSADRTQVMRETVQKLYQLPMGLMAKDGESPFFTAKTATEFIKGATDLVKEAKK